MAAEGRTSHHYGHDNPYKGLDQWDNTRKPSLPPLRAGGQKLAWPDAIGEQMVLSIVCATLRNNRTLCELCSADATDVALGVEKLGTYRRPLLLRECFCVCADCGKTAQG